MFLTASSHLQFALQKPFSPLFLVILMVTIKKLNNVLVALPLIYFRYHLPNTCYENIGAHSLFFTTLKFHYAISFHYSSESLHNVISANKACRTISPAHKHRAPDWPFYLRTDRQKTYLYIQKQKTRTSFPEKSVDVND